MLIEIMWGFEPLATGYPGSTALPAPPTHCRKRRKPSRVLKLCVGSEDAIVGQAEGITDHRHVGLTVLKARELGFCAYRIWCYRGLP